MNAIHHKYFLRSRFSGSVFANILANLLKIPNRFIRHKLRHCVNFKRRKTNL